MTLVDLSNCEPSGRIYSGAEAIHMGELPDLICTNTKSGSLSMRTYGIQ